MLVTELSRNQLEQLKLFYYETKVSPNISWGEIAAIDELVSDEEVFDEYCGICFVTDDFF